MISGLKNKSNTYMELLQLFPPRTISSEAELEMTQEIVDTLLDKNELTRDEEDYLDLLGTIIHDYEQRLEPIPDIYGVDLLSILIEENNLRQKDLVPIFKTESIVSDVLHKRRNLTVNHIEKLAKFFNVSPAAFFPRK
jgi:HTH-type transcriptional regulator / antitoxin HigA